MKDDLDTWQAQKWNIISRVYHQISSGESLIIVQIRRISLNLNLFHYIKLNPKAIILSRLISLILVKKEEINQTWYFFTLIARIIIDVETNSKQNSKLERMTSLKKGEGEKIEKDSFKIVATIWSGY